MAVGKASAGATTFTRTATRGSTEYGICSNPPLEHAFRTGWYRIEVTLHADGTWSHETDTTLIKSQSEPFHHSDRNVLHKNGEPKPSPLAHSAA